MERVGKPGVTLEMKIQTKYNYVLGRFLIWYIKWCKKSKEICHHEKIIGCWKDAEWIDIQKMDILEK